MDLGGQTTSGNASRGRLCSGFADAMSVWFPARRLGWSGVASKEQSVSELLGLVEVRGFEPLTFSLRTRRSTN
ncbi:MAG: hypothetical protein RIS92_1757 [Verrucomicrobiota bacterium]